jgi:hypothetical protein
MKLIYQYILMLLNIKNKLVDIENLDIMYNLYYNLAELPNKSLLKKKKIKNIDIFLDKIKKEISSIDNLIPLYDSFSKNIYLIKPEDIYEKVTENYYRPLTKELLNILKSIKTTDKNYKEKLEKNINFMENFDLKILEETFIKTFYYQSNKIGKNLTLCAKPSFLPFININPYYNRDELINIGLNLNIIKEDETYYDKEKITKLCKMVSGIDIDYDTLLNHYLFIQNNNLKYYVKYYSFMGSYQMNYYIRNKSIKDPIIERHITNFYNIISKSPEFNNDYYIYRLVSTDTFLSNIKIGEYFEEFGFMSTSRNPFYNPTTNAFGLILMKIKIPKNKIGIGLCMENYSLFPEEQEIILNPCRLKLVSKDENITYYHIDKKAQRSIKKKYEFEYIESIELDLNKLTKNYEKEIDIPLIDLYNTKVLGSNIEEKMDNFAQMIPLINTMKRFKIIVNEKEIILNVNKMSDKRIYEKFFFLQKKRYSSDDIISELYFTYQDEQSGEILLMIEIKDVISVNYLQKFIGCNKDFDDKLLLELISGISKMFEVYSVIIHPNYKPFSKNIEVLPKEFKNVIENETDYHQIKRLSNDIVIYNNDLINYILNKKERFENIHIKMNYKKYLLDKLEKIPVNDVITIENYEIYSLIKKEKINNLRDLIIFFFQNYFYLLDKVIYNINLYFDDQIIINKIYYIFDSGNYLFENKKINYYIEDTDKLYENYIDKLDYYSVRKDYLR